MYAYISFIHSFSCPLFLGESRGAATLGRPEMSHDQQQSQTVMAPHQDGTKQGRRYSHFTWSLDDLWAAFPWCRL